MGIISWIVVGGLAGWIAAMIMKTDHGFIKNIVIGIIGALIGGFVMGLLGSNGVTGFNLWSIFVALIGSIILIALPILLRDVANKIVELLKKKAPEDIFWSLFSAVAPKI